MPDAAFLPSPVHLPGANIKVVGVGGAGCNALDRMVQSGVGGVQLIAMNTDQQSLATSQAHVKIPLGPMSMRGLGAGGNHERGAVAAEESREEILQSLQGADMVFIAAGMGGGTGTGAAPIVAGCARELGALAVAVVLTPFHWEGPGKSQKAATGLANLRDTADTLIVVSNEKLLSLCERNVKVKEAYRAADGVLIQGVRGITDLILRPGTLNGDFADVEAVLRNGREALIGTGQGRGEEAILDALQKALDCPLLERAAQGPASQVIVSIMADWDQVELSAVQTAMRFLQEHYRGGADIKLCQVEAPELEDKALVTVLASGFDVPVDSGLLTSSVRLEPAVAATPQPVLASGAVYGEMPSTPEVPIATPTRLLPQGPTPSGEVVGMADDLHVPAIIRMTQGRLPIE
ncbi:MAG TPA: cell division protein FtsZ [Holophaga sp.]|nr:cell division protein FtsZ [Holophaga sp.]